MSKIETMKQDLKVYLDEKVSKTKSEVESTKRQLILEQRRSAALLHELNKITFSQNQLSTLFDACV
jgi:hypothetical protein